MSTDHSCGCKEGAILMLLATPTAVAILALSGSWSWSSENAAVLAATMFGSAATGKLAGLLAASVKSVRNPE